MKYTYPLLAIFHSLCGYIFSIWAASKPPNQLILNRFGIRVVSNSNENPSTLYQDTVCEALYLLEQHENEKLDEIKKHIRTIFSYPLSIEAAYYKGGRICIINYHHKLNNSSPSDEIEIAGLLVYFAELAKHQGRVVTVLGQRREDVKKNCKQEQQRIVEKLQLALQQRGCP